MTEKWYKPVADFDKDTLHEIHRLILQLGDLTSLSEIERFMYANRTIVANNRQAAIDAYNARQEENNV